MFPLVKHLKLFHRGRKNHRERRVREPEGDGDLSEPSRFRQRADSEDLWSGLKVFIKPDALFLIKVEFGNCSRRKHLKSKPKDVHSLKYCTELSN